jgi:hypothetical protein
MLGSLKHGATAVALRLVLKRVDALESQVRRVADSLDLLVKLQALGQGIPLSSLKDHSELLAMEEEVVGKVAAVDPRTGRPRESMELLVQDESELAEMQTALEHERARLGRANVPDSLDLYSVAARIRPDNPDDFPT